MSALFGHEIAGDGHAIANRDILFKHGVVLNASRDKVIAAANDLVAILELNVHDDLGGFRNLLDVDFQMSVLFSHEIAGNGHLIAFGNVAEFFQNRVVLNASRDKVIAASDDLIAILELDVHLDVGADLLDNNIQLAAFFNHEVAGFSQLVAFGQILLKNRVVLNAFGQEVVATGHELAVTGDETDAHNDSVDDLLNVDSELAALFSVEIAGNGHLVAFGEILLKNSIVLNASRDSVIAASNDLVAILEQDVHGDGFGSGFLSLDEFSPDGHTFFDAVVGIIAIRQFIAVRNGQTSFANEFGHGYVLFYRNSASHLILIVRDEGLEAIRHIVIREINVYGDIGADLLDIDDELAACFSGEVARNGHLVAFGNVLLEDRVILNASRYIVIAARDDLVAILELDVHLDGRRNGCSRVNRNINFCAGDVRIDLSREVGIL